MIADEFMVDFYILADEVNNSNNIAVFTFLHALHTLDPPSSYLDNFLKFSCIYIMKNVTNKSFTTSNFCL